MIDVKPPTAWDKSSDECSLTFRQILRPSLISMAVSGCYTYDPYEIKTGRLSDKGKPHRVFGTIYRVAVFIFCLGAFAQACAAFSTISSNFIPLGIVRVGWFTQCVVVLLLSFKFSHANFGGQRKAFDFWDTKILQEMKELGLTLPMEKIKRRQKWHLAICTSMIVCSIAGTMLMQTDMFSDGFGAFLTAPFLSTAVASKVMLAVTFLFISTVWIVPMFYIMSVSTLLTSILDAFNKFLEKHIEHNSLTMTCQFQRLRQFHVNLCKQVSLIDRDFGYYFAVLFVFSIGLACFILYVILRTAKEVIVFVMLFYYLFSILALLMAISVSAAFVNEAVSFL